MARAIHYAMDVPDRAFAGALSRALQMETWRLFFARRERLRLAPASRDAAVVMIYGFTHAQFDDGNFAEHAGARADADTARVKVFLQLATPAVQGRARETTDRNNRIIADIARACGGHVVLTADLMQTGAMQRLKPSGRPNLYGYLALAHVVIRAIKARALRDSATTKTTESPFAEEALAQLRWTRPHLPACLTNGYEQEEIDALLDGKTFFSGYRGWGKVALGEPIDWAKAGPNLSWQSYFNGLDFIRPTLAFWFDRMHGQSKRTVTAIEAALRARGASPTDCLARATAIAADFVRRNPPDAPMNPRAYAEGTVSRRMKSLLILLLCCKVAADAGTPVAAEQVSAIWNGLTDGLAMLESDEIYPKASNHGVRQDALFILVGLLFPELPYAQHLARIGRSRLAKHQFKRALSADGVWLENSFGYHCLVMNQLNDLAADLRDAGAPASDEIHHVLERMWPFAEAMIKPDGTAPLLGDTAPRYMFSALAEVRAELDRAHGREPADLDLRSYERTKLNYYFPDAGYFASHSARALPEDSSSLIFMANLSTPKHKQSDDLSVVFSRGAHDILIDGGTYNKEVSDTVRNGARFDPASHNSFRVNGGGYALRALKGMKPAGLDGMWEGKGWAAARGHNNAYADARISRTVIHLKNEHALIVYDRLHGKSSDTLFEQFWHLAPDFAPDPGAGTEHDWIFESDCCGRLLAAFCGDAAETHLEYGGPDNPIAWLMKSEDETVPTPYLRRTLRAKEATLVSLFQSADERADIAVRLKRAHGRHELNVSGVAFSARFSIGDRKVECLALTQRE